MSNTPGQDPASRRPIVRSGRLIHHRSFTYNREVAPRIEAVAPALEARSSSRPRRRFRFASAALVLAASTSMAGAETPLSGLESAPRVELVELEAPIEVMADTVEVTRPAPRVVVDIPWGSKLEGVKENPYVASPKKLVKKVPRARRVAWRHTTEEGPTRVSDLKANPYE
jgi:hypothetical protein